MALLKELGMPGRYVDSVPSRRSMPIQMIPPNLYYNHTINVPPSRPPVLFTLDNLGQISLPSAYRDTSFDIIHAHDLALPNTFLSYLSGASSFPRGLILAATSSVCSKTKDLSRALRGIEPGPWDKVDVRIAKSVEGAKVIELEKLSREEVKVIMEWYNAGGVLKQPVTIESVTEQYAISSGNPKELFQNCLRLKY